MSRSIEGIHSNHHKQETESELQVALRRSHVTIKGEMAKKNKSQSHETDSPGMSKGQKSDEGNSSVEKI